MPFAHFRGCLGVMSDPQNEPWDDSPETGLVGRAEEAARFLDLTLQRRETEQPFDTEIEAEDL